MIIMSNKSKGSAFEREICKRLTIWLIGKDKPIQFWRSAASGGLATLNSKNITVTGDIQALTPEAMKIAKYISFEAKTGYKDATFDNFFKDNKSDILRSFWIQCVSSARKSDKFAVLIFRKKGCQVIIGIDENMFKKFSKYLKLMPKLEICYESKYELPKMVIFDFEKFLETIKPEYFK